MTKKLQEISLLAYMKNEIRREKLEAAVKLLKVVKCSRTDNVMDETTIPIRNVRRVPSPENSPVFKVLGR